MNIKLILVSLLVFVFVAAQAMAVTVVVSDVSLSSDDPVVRSNPLEFGDEDELDDEDELKYVRFSIPVTATDGTVNVTNVIPNLNAFSYDPIDNDDVTTDDFSFIRTALPLTVDNTTARVELDVLVPSNLDAIDSSFNDVEHSLSIDVVTTEGTQTITGSFYAENNLELDDIEVDIDGDVADCDTDSNNDCDDEVEEITPTADIAITVFVENTFDEDSEVNFEDVEISIDSDNSDVEPDDDSDEIDVDADETESLRFSFDVDSDVEDGDDAGIDIEVIVEDDNGAQHGRQYAFDLEFELPEGEVEITGFSLSPASVCPGEVVRGTFSIENKGSDDQNNVRIQITNAPLGLDAIFTGIDLDDAEERDNDFTQSIAFRVPDNARANVYQLLGTVFFDDEDNDDTSEFVTTPLTVQSCGDQEEDDRDEEEEEEDNDSIVVTPPTTTEPTTPTQTNTGTTVATPIVSTSKSSGSDVVTIGILIVLLVVLALVVLYLIFALARHR